MSIAIPIKDAAPTAKPKEGAYAGPLQPVWMAEVIYADAAAAAKGPKWEPLWKSDCVKLEAALRSGKHELVITGGGESQIDLFKRTLNPVFWKGPERRVVRGTWFYKSSKGHLVPYQEEDAANLEALFQRAPTELQHSEEVSVGLADGKHKVVMRRRAAQDLAPSPSGGKLETDGTLPMVVTISQVLAGSLLEVLVKNPLMQSREVVRVYGEYACAREEEAEGGRLLPIDRVLFMVHGIGEAVWSRPGVSMASLKDAVEWLDSFFLRVRLEAVQRQAGDAAAAEAKAKGFSKEAIAAAAAAAKAGIRPTGRVLVLPIYWHEKVQRKELDLQKELAEVTLPTVPAVRAFSTDVTLPTVPAVTLPTVPAVRAFSTDVIGDVLFYNAPVYQRSILEEVAATMNADWRAVLQLQPGLDEKAVGIVGHSLGSVIGFDLLQAQSGDGALLLGRANMDMEVKVPRLDFAPSLFVGCGSPLGMYLTIRGDKKSPNFKLPTCDRYVNVFHPADPVAFRVEPRFDSRLALLEPAIVPHQGGYRIHFQMKRLQNDVTSNVRSTARWIHFQMKRLQKDVTSNVRNTARWWTDAIARTLQTVGPAAQTSAASSAARALEAAAALPAELASAEQSQITQRLEELSVEASSGAAPLGGEGKLVVAAQQTVTTLSRVSDQTPEELEAELEAVARQLKVNQGARLKVNQGARVDYQLQDSPLQSANQYLAAISSHASYLFDEDFAGFVLASSTT
ncbi:DDHD domain-containing protein [Tribonema minus]|uniref:DDHD domain-containing protein n=1 Tax=Tribonema minus TaxID=303371 RepID=A0A835YTJ4_9STRA|nr:DDHD domain-containing protein [Tribonema minus]